MPVHVLNCTSMDVSTVNIKPDYQKKLDEIISITKLSKTATLEFYIDADYERVVLKKWVSKPVSNGNVFTKMILDLRF